MNRLLSAFLCCAVMAPGFCLAQQPLPTTIPTGSQHKSLEITPTPEMWFYEQERLRSKDPNEMARARAEFQANQRQARIAAQKWYGYSAARPTVGTDPIHGVYSPRWVGNGTRPTDWSLVSPAPTYGGVIAIDRVRR